MRQQARLRVASYFGERQESRRDTRVAGKTQRICPFRVAYFAFAEIGDYLQSSDGLHYLFEGADASSTRMRSSDVKNGAVSRQNDHEWEEKESHCNYYPIILFGLHGQELNHRSSQQC